MIGVVADDITGANDIGIMFAKKSFKVDVIFNDFKFESILHPDNSPDMLVIDTDSRFDTSEDAYRKVYEATKALHKLGVSQYINKTCSVFRGNIGVEFDAMLDALKENFAVVILGFPKNGRKTLGGIHYVHGKPLHESEFKSDPMHPMSESNLVSILQKQTSRKVTSIPLEDVLKGASFLEKKINELKKDFNYIILDVSEQSDLKVIAQAVKDIKILCGSSAIAEELANLEYSAIKKEEGILTIAGSLMPQTSSQIQYMKDKGEVVIELDTLKLLDSKYRESELEEIIARSTSCINNGRNVIVHSANTKEKVANTKKKALEKGLTNKELSQLVSKSLATIAKNVLVKSKQNKLLVAGGDTSAAVCREFNVTRMRVLQEIQPGLPSCLTLQQPNIALVLKSGSFGTNCFFEDAIEHLKELNIVSS